MFASFLSVGVKAGIQGRLLAGTHLSVPSHEREQGERETRDIRLYTGVDRIGRSAKRATGTKQRDSPGISIDERVEAVGPAAGRREVGREKRSTEAESPEPELARGKKTLTAAVRVLDGCCGPNQPPTAKNLIRCHNYTQWCSTGID